MDDTTSTDNESEGKKEEENIEGLSTHTKSEEETRKSSNGVQWMKEKIEAFNDETQDGEVEEILKFNTETEIFKAIVNLRKFKLLKFFTENDQNFIANVSLDLWIELINLAAEKEFFEIFQELKKFESHFDADYEYQTVLELEYEYKNVLDDIKTLHEDICEGKLDKVKNFIEKYPQLKFCYGLGKVSALERSIDASQLEIFEIFLDKSFDKNCDESFIRKILKSIVSRRKLNFVQIFIQSTQNLIAKVNLKLWTELINLSAEKEFFEIFQELKRFEESYEKKLNERSSKDSKRAKIEVDYEYKNVLHNISKLHKNISKGKLDKVKNFIKKYPKLKLCCGFSEVSALERSIDTSQLKIFDQLLSAGFDVNEDCAERLCEKFLKNSSKVQILKSIVSHRKLNFIQVLATNQHNFYANIDFNLWIELTNLAAEKEFFEIYQELKKFEKNYEKEIHDESLKNRKKVRQDLLDEYNCYKNVLDDISMLHTDISEGKFKKVKNFIEKYPMLKFCYAQTQTDNFCALERAIKEKQFKIYVFLRVNGFEASDSHRLGRSTINFRLQSLMSELTYEEKKFIKDENFKMAQVNPNYYVDLVYQNCKLDRCSNESCFKEIKELLKFLYKIESFKSLIEILAETEVKIAFDLKNETIEEFDPNRCSTVYGVTYGVDKEIIVGRNQSSEKFRGTFIHEVSHFVLDLIYENNFLPFRVEDKEKEKEYEKVLEITREISERNPNNDPDDCIVRRVFNQKSTERKELIVRVNHLIATFHGKPKLDEYKKLYAQLFDFYETFVLPDLKRNFYKILKLNNDFELFEEIRASKFQVKDSENLQFIKKVQNHKNFLIFSDVPQMTLSKLLQEISKKSSNKLEAKAKNLFINFERLQQENLRKEFEEILKSSKKILRLVIHLKVDENQSEEKIEESLKLLKVLTKFSCQIFLVASFDSEKILKVAQKVFEVENSKVEIEGESLKFIEESKTFESSQSDLKFLKVELKNFWSDLTEKSQKEILKLEIKFRAETFPITSLLEGNILPQTLNFLSLGKELEVKIREAKEIKFYFERNFLKFKGTEDKSFDTESKESDEEENLSDDSNSEKSKDEECSSDNNSESDDSSSDDSDYSESDSEEENLLTLGEFIDRNLTSKVLQYDTESQRNEEKNCFIKGSESFWDSPDKFIDQNLSSKVVLISEIAGSGKTTLLHKIHQTLSEKFQNFWICFVSLLKHKKILLDRGEISESFLDFLCDKILNLCEIEKKIFELKYERNEVVILFDGFDEISPDSKRNAIKIFKLHKQSEKSQIWITTRTHLEKDLEEELQVKAHKIKPLNEKEQIKFLCKFWEENCVDSDLRKKSAKKLVKEIEKMRRWWKGEESLIGLTLQLRLLGELFKEELCEDFDAKIKNLSLSRVYEFLIERSVKFKEQNSVHDILKLHSDIYQVLALKRWTKDSKKFKDVSDHLFGFNNFIEELDEKLEELTRGGIISYDENGEISFLHRTVEEFFVWLFAFNRIKNFKKNWKFEKEFCEFFDELLSTYIITLLDECFKELWTRFNEKSQKNFEGAKNFAQSFHKIIVKKKERIDFFEWIGDISISKISHSTLFVLKAIKFASDKTFQKILESEGPFSKSYFISFFQNVRDPEICEEFLEEVFKTFPDDLKLFEFLMRKNKNDQTVFHQIVEENHFNLEAFKKFWSKVEKRNFGHEKVLKIFFEKDKNGKNFFTCALWNLIDEKESSKRIDAVIEIVKRNLKVEDQRKLLREVQFGVCGSEKSFLRVFEFLREIFSAEEIFEVLTSVDDNGKTFLHQAAESRSSPDVIKKFFEEILKGKEEKIVKEFLLKRDGEGGNALITSASSRFDYENFFYLFDEIFLKFFTFQEFAYEVDERGWNILHSLACEGNPRSFKHFMKKAQVELSKEDFKKFCHRKTKKLENVFHLIAQSWDFYTLKLKVEFLSKLFTRDEMRIFLSEFDDEGRLSLHYAAKNKYEEIFDLYEKNFNADEILKFFEAKDKEEKNV